MEWRRRLCWVALVIALLVCVGIFWYRAKRKEHPYTDAVLAAEEFSGKNFSAGGKTGTAQVPEGPDNGLFIGFAPFENPEIAVCVVIEHGSGTHAPRAASEIMSEWIVNSGNR